MEEKEEISKKSNTKIIVCITIVVLIAIVGGVLFNSFANKDKSVVEKGNSKNEKYNNNNKEVEKTNTTDQDSTSKGGCPLVLFSKDYKLTVQDKDDIIKSLDSMNIGFTNVDVNSIAITGQTENAYAFSIKFNLKDRSDTLAAIVAKVNNEFKVLNAGSGFDTNDLNSVYHMLQRICMNETVSNSKVKGECPLTKLSKDYKLTTQDKDEIIKSLDSMNAGFTNVDANSIAITGQTENTYAISIKFNLKDHSDTLAAIVTKVNNKFKVLNAGSGFDTNELKTIGYTLQRICSKNSTATTSNISENNTTEEKVNKIMSGNCPLEKFNSNYVLTQADKKEIMDSIVSTYSITGYDASLLKINKVADSGYFFSVGVDSTNERNGFFVYVSKVNGKFKVIGGGGSGDTSDGYDRMNSTIEYLCKEVKSSTEAPKSAKGNCSLTKFNSNYVLTQADKKEIMDSIVSTYSITGYDASLLKINKVADSGYFFSVGVDSTNERNGFFVYVSKVNGKFKVIGGGGSGDTSDGYDRMNSTIEYLCK